MGNYANDYNTMRFRSTFTYGGKKAKKSVTDYIIWKTAEHRFKAIEGDCMIVLSEIYKRLRKIPEYDGSVAIIFAQSEYAICKKYEMEQEHYNHLLRELIEKEIVNVVYAGEEYKILSLDRSIFLANYIYYKDSGEDSKACAAFNMQYEIDTEKEGG